ncbi:nucleoside triphosphate pyrophosphohydrolase [Hyphomicrobium sp.]|uniref:nucleoside triphosphate pyrophosphohydrolase n=1 Tax=Hyphomicrobium sp. TaxID=82 RepID=UPI002E333F2B|nr:nucleoside triphosphate pyrophosphohydrolase [Hyphomicrobium sp.]HEX2843047.1 nucleoside triphosphate pyrophosphohydrolase [Hyphomicrobium sp.]
MKPSKDIARLIEIMAALRTPVTGCPWDLEQTFATIAPYTIEEAYEVADAIARCDMPDLKDELGDLLLQVVYHARMAEEQHAFAFGDVVQAITAKMIRRHPHVFGTAEERAAGASPGFWAKIKAEERAAKAAERPSLSPTSQSSPGVSLPTSRRGEGLLADVSLSLPALTRAIKLQDKAACVGFDWPSLAPVFDKMREELAELEDVAIPADPRGANPDGSAETTAKIAEEFGDLLFVMANVARHLKLDPETALRAANDKFVRRFRHIEDRLAEQNRSPDDATLAEMDALWDEAKARERSST